MRGVNHGRCRTIALSATVAIVLALAAGTGIALLLAPAIVGFCLLMLGLQPGEQLIDRLRERRRRLRAPRAPRTVAARDDAVITPRTAWLAASALAMRPPPLVPTSIS